MVPRRADLPPHKRYYRLQFGDVLFYQWLLSVGLTSKKSLTISELAIPDEYFFDFLRGAFDGDGCFYSYFDPRWKSSFVFYTTFVSASIKHITWLREEIHRHLGISGHVTRGKKSTVYQLKYAKEDSFKILKNMYHSIDVVCLSRKRVKVEAALAQNEQSTVYI